MSRNRLRIAAAVALVVASVTLAGLAAAAPAEPDGDVAVETWYPDALGRFLFRLTDPTAEPAESCVVENAGVGSDPAPGSPDTGEPGLPEGCVALDVTGPNRRVNHGAIVSSFARWLKDAEIDGSRGSHVRQVAGSDWGKGDAGVKAGNDADDGAGDDPVGESAGGRDRSKGDRRRGHDRRHGED